MAFAQHSDDQIRNISGDACNCIEKIDGNTEHRNEAIKNCIAEAIVHHLKEDNAAADKGVQEIKINKRDYIAIEKYLTENCTALKNLTFSEMDNLEHANSKNVLAQLAYEDGMAYMQEKEYDMAIKKFTKAIELDPKFAFAWDNLGICYRKTNQYEDAIKAYEKSLEINPKGKMPLINIAVTYNLKKEFKQAIKYYARYIELYGDDPEGYYGISLIQYTNNQYEKGLENMIIAYTLYTEQQSPYRSDAAGKIGYMYNDLKKQDKLAIFNKTAAKYNLKFNIK